jgi:hypothetical protein
MITLCCCVKLNPTMLKYFAFKWGGNVYGSMWTKGLPRHSSWKLCVGRMIISFNNNIGLGCGLDSKGTECTVAGFSEPVY